MSALPSPATTSGEVGVPLAPPARPLLPFRTKFFFAIGYFGEAIGLFSISSFAMVYYNQVLGLRADLAGLALSASLLLDGPSDLLMGFISDRTRSRFGRRHFYMYVAPVPIAVALYCIFNPPGSLGPSGMFLWFLAWVIALRQFMNIFHTPHAALGGELSGSYTERSTVMAYGSFATSIGAAAQAFVAYSIFFVATAQYPQGVLNPAPWQSFSFTLAATVLVVLYASAWFTRDRIPHLPVPPEAVRGFPLRAFFRDVAMVFSNRNFCLLILGYFCLTMTTGIRTGISIYTNTFYWELPSADLRWVALSSLIGALFAFFVTPRLHRRFEKKPTIIVASLVQAIAPAVPILLSFTGQVSPGTSGLLLMLIVSQSIGWFGYGVLTIGVLSAMADVADENDLRFGVRQEGVMYAMRNMFGKVDQAIGAALVGMILTWIAFPRGAKPGEVAPHILQGIAISDGVLATIPGLIAVIPYLFYRINRQTHAETQAAIARRNAGS